MSAMGLGLLCIVLGQFEPVPDASSFPAPEDGSASSSLGDVSLPSVLSPDRPKAPAGTDAYGAPGPSTRVDPPEGLPTASPGSLYGTPPTASVLAPGKSSPQGLSAMPAATFQAPRVTSTSPAGQVLESAMRPPTRGELSGQPLALTQLLSRIGVREGRKAAVLSYWRLCMAVAQYHFSVDEVLRLQRMPQPRDAYGQKQFAAVQSSAQARVTADRLKAIRAQREVARFTSEAAAALPLAADRPFVGAYQTHYQVLREHGAAPLQLALIDQTLPVQQQLIADLAVAVQSADELVEAAAGRYQQQRLPLADVLGALTSLRDQRIGFLSAVESYNASIAEYALTVNLPAASGDRLVGMLIETTPGAERSVLTDRSRSGGDIQRVSNEEPLQPAARNDPSVPEPASVSPHLPSAQTGVLLPVPQSVDPASADPAPMQFPYPAAPTR